MPMPRMSFILSNIYFFPPGTDPLTIYKVKQIQAQFYFSLSNQVSSNNESDKEKEKMLKQY